jgi:hypothetical protein
LQGSVSLSFCLDRQAMIRRLLDATGPKGDPFELHLFLVGGNDTCFYTLPRGRRRWGNLMDETERKESGVPQSARMCSRCGGTLKFALQIPRSVGQPAYEIFNCAACGLFNWIAQQEP